MAWTRYPASKWGLDAMPIDSACQVDLVRGDQDHLMRESPLGCGTYFVNGVPSTAATTYTDASTLWRSPRMRLYSGLDRPYRNIKCRLYASVSANPGTIRICCSTRWRIVSDPPGNGDAEAESAAGAVTSVVITNPDQIVLTLTPPQSAIYMWDYGKGDDDRSVTRYRTTYLQIQGRVPAGGTIFLVSFNIEEVDV